MPQISSKPTCLALESGTPSVQRAALLSAENRDLCRAARASKHSPLLRALLVLAPTVQALRTILYSVWCGVVITNACLCLHTNQQCGYSYAAVPLFGRHAAVTFHFFYSFFFFFLFSGSVLFPVGRTLPLLQNTARRPQKRIIRLARPQFRILVFAGADTPWPR